LLPLKNSLKYSDELLLKRHKYIKAEERRGAAVG
jgi:hypothetical protein